MAKNLFDDVPIAAAPAAERYNPREADRLRSQVGAAPAAGGLFDDVPIPPKPGELAFTNRSPITLGSILRNPGYALGTLWDQAKETASTVTRDGTLLGVGAKALTRAIAPETALPDTRPAPLQPQGALEQAVGLLGGLAGSITTPESLVAAPARAAGAASQAAGRALGSRVAGEAVVRGAEGAAVNAASDIPIQAGNIALGDQEKYDPMGTVANAAFGAVLGGGMGAAGAAAGPGRPQVDPQRVDQYIQTRDAQLAETAAPQSNLFDDVPIPEQADAEPDIGNPITEPAVAALEPNLFDDVPAAPSAINTADLPADMQGLVQRFTGGQAPETLTVREVRVEDLPEAPMIDPERGPEYASEIDLTKAPPVIIADGQFIDGRHRAFQARQTGQPTLRAIDLTGIADPETVRVASHGPIQETVLPDLIEAKVDQPSFQEQLAGGDVVSAPMPDGNHLNIRRIGADQYEYNVSPTPQAGSSRVGGTIGFVDGKGLKAVAETAGIPDLLEARTTGPLLRGQPIPGATPAPDPTNIPRLPMSMKEMAEELVRTLRGTHRQGDVGARGALGTYNRKSGMVRTLGMQEMDVLSHEMAHHLEFTKQYPTLHAAFRKHANELRVLDYEPQKARRHEGFAEWFRWYMTNPDIAARAAPNFLPEFEAAMAKDLPKEFARIKELQGAYTAWREAPSATRAVADITYNKPETAIDRVKARLKERGARGIASSARTALVDRLEPLAQARDMLVDLIQEKTGRRVDLKAADDFYKLARMVPGAYDAGYVDISAGVVPANSPDMIPQGPSLTDALEHALGPRSKVGEWTQEAIEEFDAYLIARRMVGEWERFQAGKLEQQPDRFSLEDHLEAIRTFEQANPTFANAAQMVYDWQNNIWRKMFDGGLIDGETYLRGLEHKDYVPALRDRSDVPEIERGLGASGTGENAGKVRAFYGSLRQKISPTQSMMKNAFRTNMLLARNDVLKAMWKLAETAGADAGRLVERRSLQTNATNAMEVLTKAADQAGIDPRDAAMALDDLRTTLSLKPGEDLFAFGPATFDAKGEPVVYMWEDGNMVPLRLADGFFGKEMFEALTDMTPAQTNIWSEIAATPARLLRTGIVSHPSFILRNIFVDGMTTWATTDVGYIPYWDTVRGIYHNIRQTPLAKQYSASKGAIGGSAVAAERDARVQQEIKALRQNGIPIRRIASIKGLMDFLAKASEITETGTRLGVFERGIKEYMKRGYTPREAIIEAAFTARDYMDFDLRGSAPGMKEIQKATPFLRSWVVGLDRITRTLAGMGDAKAVLAPLVSNAPPATAAEKARFAMAMKAWSLVSALAVLSYGITRAYVDDEEYQSFNDDIRATHWLIRMPEWMPRYGGEWLALPKPYEWAFPADLAERMVEAAHGDTDWAKRMVSDAANILAPPLSTPIVRLPFELATNRTSMGQPIVPEHLKNVEETEQFTASTSELAKRAAEIINGVPGVPDISPAVLEHIFKSVTGSIGRDVVEVTDSAIEGGRAKSVVDDPIVRRFVKTPERGSRASEAFWGLVSGDDGKFEKAKNTFQLRKDRDINEAFDDLYKLQPAERAYVLMSTAPGLNGAQRRVHPLIMAKELVGVMSTLRRDLREGAVKGAGLQDVELADADRVAADEGLAQRIMALQTNALIAAGVKGWTHREPMRLAPLPPDAQAALNNRLVSALIPADQRAALYANPDAAAAAVEQTVLQAERAWAATKPMIEATPRDSIQGAYDTDMWTGARGMNRFVHQVTPR